MPSFPRSGSWVKLTTDVSHSGKVLQVVPPKAGSWPREVCHQLDEKALLADLCVWSITKVEEGGIELVPCHYLDLRLSVVEGKVVLDEGTARKYG